MARLVIVDTSVLIDFRRCASDALRYCEPLVLHGVAALHPVCGLELIEGVDDPEAFRNTRRMLSGLR